MQECFQDMRVDTRAGCPFDGEAAESVIGLVALEHRIWRSGSTQVVQDVDKRGGIVCFIDDTRCCGFISTKS